MAKTDFIYEKITNKIIGMLDKGVIPWQKPWKGSNSFPLSYSTKKEYTGINSMLLAIEQEEIANKLGLPISRLWFTFKQANELGGKVKKGSSAKMVIFWKKKTYNSKDSDGNIERDSNGDPIEKSISFLRYYKVFNYNEIEFPEEVIEKIKKYDIKETEDKNNNKIEKAENIINNYLKRENIEIIESNKAAYNIGVDKIKMPNIDKFDSSDHYYSTFFHEAVHSTGASKRLNREEVVKSDGFGQANYSKEELIAEFGASYLCGITGINNEAVTKNNIAYIQGWLSALKNDKRMIISASGKAQHASNYILDIKE